MDPDANISEALNVLIREKGLINDVIPSIDIFDFDYFDARIKELQEAFPESFFCHSLALKANTMRGVIKRAKSHGMGAEGASISEVVHAIRCGFPAEMVVYDSPCKSKVIWIIWDLCESHI